MSLRVSELEVQIQRLSKILPSELPKDIKAVAKPQPPPAKENEDDDDEEIDLFGSDVSFCLHIYLQFVLHHPFS